MNRVIVWLGAAIVGVAVLAAVMWIRGSSSQMAQRPKAPQSAWIVVEHPPVDRPTPLLQVVRKFGPWRLTCRELPQKIPAVAPIQNFGMTQPPGSMGPANTCHVSIMMVNRAEPRQRMLFDFRYMRGNSMLGIATLETRPTHETMLPPPRNIGTLNRATNKIIPDTTVRQHDVEVQLGKHSVLLETRGCRNGHCLALYRADAAVVDKIGPDTIIIVRLPALAKGKVRPVRLPAEGLAQALSDLRALTPS